MLVQRTCSVARQRWSSLLQSSNLVRPSFSSYFSTNEANETATDEPVKESPAAENEELKKLNDAISELTDKYKRSLAETENVRTRLRKEIHDAKVYGIQAFCKDLLTVADVINMAVSSIPREKLTAEHDETWTSFYEGVRLTDKELHRVFERHGLHVVEPQKGDKFDPTEHEALFESPIEGMEGGKIAHVERIGYKLKERTLRPAQVGVSAKQS